RLQVVTQCMSAVISSVGSRVKSSHVSRTGFSTSPAIRKSHVRGSNRGTVPSCITGHLSVADCPGGRRPASRIARSSFFLSEPSVNITCNSPARSQRHASLYNFFFQQGLDTNKSPGLTYRRGRGTADVNTD